MFSQFHSRSLANFANSVQFVVQHSLSNHGFFYSLCDKLSEPERVRAFLSSPFVDFSAANCVWSSLQLVLFSGYPIQRIFAQPVYRTNESWVDSDQSVSRVLMIREKIRISNQRVVSSFWSWWFASFIFPNHTLYTEFCLCSQMWREFGNQFIVLCMDSCDHCKTQKIQLKSDKYIIILTQTNFPQSHPVQGILSVLSNVADLNYNSWCSVLNTFYYCREVSIPDVHQNSGLAKKMPFFVCLFCEASKTLLVCSSQQIWSFCII